MMKNICLICLLLVAYHPTFSQSLIAYYTFSGNANDESGNGYDGTLFGGATANDTLVIGDNDSDYVSLPENLLEGLTDFTILFKVKYNVIHPLGFFPANTIIHAWGNSYENELKISQNQSVSSFQIDVKDVQPLYGFVADTGHWHCYAIVREGDLITLYVDGAQVGNTQSSASGSLDPYSGGMVLGQEEDCIGGCFAQEQSLAGKLDDLAFYNYAFTAQEAISSSCQNCGDKLFMPFTVDAADSSGNILDGTLGGNATVDNGVLSIGDNGTDYLAVPDAALNGLTNFDISFSGKFDQLHSNGSFPANTVIHAWGNVNQDELKISLDGNANKFYVGIQTSGNSFDFYPDSGVWNCFHVQRKSDSLFVYQNGQFLGFSTVPSGGLQVASGGITIGQEQDCVGGCFEAYQSLAGELDNFRINNCPLPIPKDEKCDFPTTVLEQQLQSFSIFPNPANDEIIFSGMFENGSSYFVDFISVVGNVISKKIVATSSSIKVTTADLPSGVYLARIKSNEAVIANTKIVIQH